MEQLKAHASSFAIARSELKILQRKACGEMVCILKTLVNLFCFFYTSSYSYSVTKNEIQLAPS